MKVKAVAISLVVPALPLITILVITVIPSVTPNISSKNWGTNLQSAQLSRRTSKNAKLV
ncbi:MAG: hypothetical protein JRN20_21995 [Nitrososphaerota archaeon]|nr:hypothetical protein [Nitrososphaerota archaeon]